MKAWIFILIAAIFQTFWGITLKFLDFKKIVAMTSRGDVFSIEFVWALIPLLLYFIIGLVIVVFISKAYKLMPMSIVYAYWMGLTLVFQTFIDLLYFKEHFEWIQFGFLTLILIGIIGMKISTTKVEPEVTIVDKLNEMEDENEILSE